LKQYVTINEHDYCSTVTKVSVTEFDSRGNHADPAVKRARNGS
jgi:hypothetical protein